MLFKSKIDWWLKVIIWGVIIIIILSIFFISNEEKVIYFCVSIPMILFLIWLYFGTYYEFRETYLLSRSGPFYEKIYYNKIKSVKLCNNLLSSMALSINRIEIKQHGKGYFMGTTYISPEDREEFAKKLISYCNNIQIK